MIRIAHAVAGSLALGFVCAFWLATVTAELSGALWAIVGVKTAILWAMIAFVPLVAGTAVSGFVLGRHRRDRTTRNKRARMPVIGANGALVLLPAAVFLWWKASAGELDGWFAAIQGIELVAGALNATLLGLSLRDGLRLTGRLRRRRSPTSG